MWPAESDDHPSPEWVGTSKTNGFYILHLNFPIMLQLTIAMPTAERESWNIPRACRELSNAIRRTSTRARCAYLFPLLGWLPAMLLVTTSTPEALAQQLLALDHSIRPTYEDNYAYYQNLLNGSMSIETPDANLNEAFSWAKVSIDQLRVRPARSAKKRRSLPFLGQETQCALASDGSSVAMRYGPCLRLIAKAASKPRAKEIEFSYTASPGERYFTGGRRLQTLSTGKVYPTNMLLRMRRLCCLWL